MQGSLLVAIFSVVDYAAWIYIPWALVWTTYLAHVQSVLTSLKIIDPTAVTLTMITAAETGNLKYISERVNADPSVINKELDFWHRGVLYWSAYYGHVDVVNYVLENGADINHRSETNWTALHAAAINNHVNIVRILVEKGVDLTVRDLNNLSARKLAVFFGIKEAADVLRELEINKLGQVFEYGLLESKEEVPHQAAAEAEKQAVEKVADLPEASVAN